MRCQFKPSALQEIVAEIVLAEQEKLEGEEPARCREDDAASGALGW